jgi:hypothetical protein
MHDPVPPAADLVDEFVRKADEGTARQWLKRSAHRI